MSKQIFQTDNTSRWKKFKWSFRIVVFFFSILIFALILTLVMDRMPNVPFKRDYRGVITASKPFMEESKLSKAYKGFRSYIHEKNWHSNYAKQKASREKGHKHIHDGKIVRIRQKKLESWKKVPAGIRAAFYVAWDPQSLFSLKRNVSYLNLVLPEWFFIDPARDKLKTSFDPQGFSVMKKAGIPIMPMLSNFSNGDFRPEAVGRILHSAPKRKIIINQLLSQCLFNHFVGINVDFEQLAMSDRVLLVSFIKELSLVFHEKGLLVTQDIIPFDHSYDIKSLAKYDDYFFLMAYNEYGPTSDSGPICSQKWIEAAVDNIACDVPSGKIVLGLGAFGYDWKSTNGDNESLTYQQALSRASASDTDIHFDNDTYNLDYSYADGNNVLHQVFFTDAATYFNTMRFGSEYGLAGFGIWRLGSEDGRVWKFYSKNMEKTAVLKIKKSDIEDVKTVNNVDYIGDGEVLDVLNTPHPGEIKTEIDSTEMLISEEKYLTIPSSYQIEKLGEAEPKQLLLTFDDGPDARWTPQILSILDKYHIHAAFFVVGLQAERNLPLIKKIYDAGHLIGNHTFTHRNVAYNTPARTHIELELTRLLIECVTGHSTILFRAPYNADSEPSTMEEIVPVALARKDNYLDVGEAVDPEDWQVGIKSDSIFVRVVNAVKQGRGHIILLHDAGGVTREETIKALPRIIEYFQKRGYTFTTLTNILHRSKQDLMPVEPKGNGYYVMLANLTLATLIYDAMNFLTALFIIFIILGFGRLIFMMVLAHREKRRMSTIHYDKGVLMDNAPLVSIIVPAYNEEVNAVSSINNLLEQDYPNFNIIFVDDGSKDDTYRSVCNALSTHEKVKIFTKTNGGKASALNFGIEHTDAEYVVCIDADTKLYQDAVSLMILHFIDNKGIRDIGAVAGNVKVGNQVNWLTKWQAIEYVTSQNFDRLAYANINAVTVVPGAIGAFKKSAIDAAGGLTTDTLAEDCDLTIRILRAGFYIENENSAIAMTEAPEKIGQFVKQRTRWSFGVMQTFWKHRDTLLNKKYKGLGLWAMPNMLIFQFLIPTFSPLADLFMIIGLFSGNAMRILVYYLLFMLVDASISVVAFLYEKDKLYKLLLIIPQRFCYRWIMYVVFFKSYMKAIKGELQTWGVLKRTGNVGDLCDRKK